MRNYNNFNAVLAAGEKEESKGTYLDLRYFGCVQDDNGWGL